MTFITKKHLSRRTFLRGAGVAVALPFLESMVPAQTPLAKTAASPMARWGFIYVPHGSIMKQWTPAKEGVDFEFSPILKPLEPFRNYVTVVSGLYNTGESGHSPRDRKSTRLNSSHLVISYAVFCLKKKKI